MRAALLMILLGCGGTTAVDAPRPNPWPDGCPTERPRGAPTDYAAPELAEVTIAAPQACGRFDSFIRVERASGTRKLADADKLPAPKEACVKLPANPADPNDCPLLHPGVIAVAVREELAKRGIGTIGWGLMPCGPMPNPYNEVAPAINDWKDAEQAVRVVAEIMERYDVAGHSGAAVRGIKCVVPASSRSISSK